MFSFFSKKKCLTNQKNSGAAGSLYLLYRPVPFCLFVLRHPGLGEKSSISSSNASSTNNWYTTLRQNNAVRYLRGKNVGKKKFPPHKSKPPESVFFPSTLLDSEYWTCMFESRLMIRCPCLSWVWDGHL